MTCVICGREIEPAPRFFTESGAPRHMLCEESRTASLTANGLEWAKQNAATSMIANVALYGSETGWPANLYAAAIETANEQGGKP